MASRNKGLVWRMSAVAALLLAAAPLAAQDNSTVSEPPAAPAPAENIGPRELQNFSLEGTVTRRAEEPAAPPATPAVRETARRDTAPAPTEAARPEPVRSAATDARADANDIGLDEAGDYEAVGASLLRIEPGQRSGDEQDDDDDDSGHVETIPLIPRRARWLANCTRAGYSPESV